MGLETRPARVVENRALTHDVRHLVLAPLREGGQPFRAGQYILVPAPGLAGPRPFSIASSPRAPERLELLFRRIEDGLVTNALAALRAGDVLMYSGPLGGFALDPEDERRLFVATGTGISPLRSMILAELEAGDTRPAILVFGNRSPSDLFCIEEFRGLEREHPSFRFVPCLSRPDSAAWHGEVGRVTQVLPRVVENAAGWSAYVCGNEDVIADARCVLGGLSLSPERFYREP